MYDQLMSDTWLLKVYIPNLHKIGILIAFVLALILLDMCLLVYYILKFVLIVMICMRRLCSITNM